MSLGINRALQNHVKNLSIRHWQLQREFEDLPVCDIKVKTTTDVSLPSYLDNKDNFTLIKNIPVLIKPVKYVDTQGKIQVDDGLYFIFREDVNGTTTHEFTSKHIINKDDIILYNGSTYVVTQILDDGTNSGLFRVETKLP